MERAFSRCTVAVVAMAIVGLPRFSAAQAVSAAERQALVALYVERGGQAADVDALVRIADEAAAKGLPTGPLTSKIREGLAKRADPPRIGGVIRQMVVQLETADELVRELAPAVSATAREAGVTLLAESLGGGVTPAEVRDLGRLAQPSGKPAMSPDSLASAAKGLWFIKDAKLPVAEGTAVVAEAARQGYRANDFLDLGREIKRRERDYQSGRASLLVLRDAIARGQRPDQLFRDGRTDVVERPATDRPEPATIERPERPTRPEPPQRPERPIRPETPERPGTGRE